MEASGSADLLTLHKQARLLSKQYLHASAIAVAGTAVASTHALRDVRNPAVGLYTEAVFLLGSMLMEAKHYSRACACFFRVHALLEEAQAIGNEAAIQEGVVSSRGLPNFANAAYVLVSAPLYCATSLHTTHKHAHSTRLHAAIY